MNDRGQQRFTFPKEERLTEKKLIEGLFTNGSSFYLHPFLVKYQKAEDERPYHRVLFSVPRKKFKKAVQRNLLKRRMKEAYRLNKHRYSPSVEKPAFYNLAFIYLDPSILPYKKIEDKLIALLQRLENQNQKVNEK